MSEEQVCRRVVFQTLQAKMFWQKSDRYAQQGIKDAIATLFYKVKTPKNRHIPQVEMGYISKIVMTLQKGEKETLKRAIWNRYDRT